MRTNKRKEHEYDEVEERVKGQKNKKTRSGKQKSEGSLRGGKGSSEGGSGVCYRSKGAEGAAVPAC